MSGTVDKDTESPFLIMGLEKGKTNEQIARSQLRFTLAVSKTKTNCAKTSTSEISLEDVSRFEERVAVLCGDSFKLTWSTESTLRKLHNLGKLPGDRFLAAAFCKRHLRLRDCPSPWQLLLHCEWLRYEKQLSYTTRYLLRNFKQATQYPFFLSVPASLLAHFLSDPGLVLDREIDAIRALALWLQHSSNSRSSQVNELLRFVHVERLSPDELLEVEMVLRKLGVPLSMAHMYQRRQCRFHSLTNNLGIRIYMSLTRCFNVELSELLVGQRRWDIRLSYRLRRFQTEALTGTHRTIFMVGDEDLALLYQEGKSSPELVALSPEFLGPMAYRFVSRRLYAVQNHGWKLKVWTRNGPNWTPTASRTSTSWLYKVQIFSNGENLFFAGQRDKPRKPSSKGNGIIVRPEPCGKIEPFLWSWHLETNIFKTTPRFPCSDASQNLGPTISAFWTVQCSTSKIWMMDLGKNTWQETKLHFPEGHRVVCSCCCGNSLLILSFNVTRGVYLTLSFLADEPEPSFGVVGSLPFDVPKEFARDILTAARFLVISENQICF